MNEEILDLSIIFGNKGIDHEIYKSQFGLFLHALDNRLKDRGSNLKRRERLQHYFYDYYGLKPNFDKVLINPHYGISFNNENIKIALTTKLTKTLYKKLTEKIRNYLLLIAATVNPVEHAQYFICFSNYRLVDRKGHAILGENFDTFKLYAKLSEIVHRIQSDKDTVEQKVIKFSNMFPYALEFHKKFEFGIEFDFLNFKNIREEDQISEQLRGINLQFLKNPQLILDKFDEFILRTSDIFLDIAKENHSEEFIQYFSDYPNPVI